jgi:hypothetical protein
LWEAFLLQMNDFDKFLDLQLRHMLDPIVATPAPPRRNRRPKAGRLILAVEAPFELAPEAIPVVEAVVVTVSAATPQL